MTENDKQIPPAHKRKPITAKTLHTYPNDLYLDRDDDYQKPVERAGNSDARILAKAYEEFAKDGLTPFEKSTLEKLDDVLHNAAIVISKDGSFATIVDDNGNSFKVNAHKPSGKSR